MMRALRVAPIGLMVAGVMSACGASATGGRTSIDVMVSGDPEEIEAYRQVAEGFEKAQEAVSVNLIEIADRDEMITKLATSFAGGSPPDVFLMNYRYVGQFFSKSAVEPVAPYLAKSDQLSEDEFYPEALDAFRFDGDIVCLPQNVATLVVYYNEDLFSAAGMEPPRAGWTWDEMVDAARAITKDEDGDGKTDIYGLGVDPEIIRLAPFVWSNGGEVVDSETEPTRFTLTSPPAAQAMQAFFDLRRVAKVVPTDVEAESEDFESRFLNGRLGMIMESRKVVPGFRTITDFGWDVAPLPVFKKPATILHSDAYCMTEASEHKDDSWEFLEFALGEEGQRIAVATGRTVPSLKTVAESQAFLGSDEEPQNEQVFLDNVPLIRRVPHISTWPEIEDATNGLLEEGFYLGSGAEEISHEVVRVTRPLFERAEA